MEESKKKLFVWSVFPFLVEISIILALTGIVIFVLNYFKFINISALINNTPIQPINLNEFQKTNREEKKPKQTWNGSVNPALPNMQIVIQSNALNYEFQVFEIEGRVGSIIDVPGFDPVQKIPFAVRLDVKVGTGSAQIPLLYSEQALKIIKITDSQNNKLTFKDLESGDEVTIKTTISTFMQYPDNYYGVEIKKK